MVWHPVTRESWIGADRGAGTPLALALAAVPITLNLIVVPSLHLAIQNAKLQEVVDLAAIAAEQTIRGANTGSPCERAQQILISNMAEATKCSIVGEEDTVVATQTVVGIVLNATASATST